MRSYANLQILKKSEEPISRESLMAALCTAVEPQGWILCDKEQAARTIAAAPTPRGWVVFDDQADRADLPAMHELGKGVTRLLHLSAIGILGCRESEERMLCLYENGRLRDVYQTGPHTSSRCGWPFWLNSCGRAVRWKREMAPGVQVTELADLFVRIRQGEQKIGVLLEALALDSTTAYGFASLEEAHLSGVISLYFRLSTGVQQPRSAQTPAASGRRVPPVGACFCRRRSGRSG